MRHHLGQSISQLRFEPVPTRVRATLAGETVLDTRRAALVWEPRRLVPVYAAPVDDLAAELLPADPQPAPPDLAALAPMLGPDDFGMHTTPGRVADLVAGRHRLPAAGFLPEDEDLAGLVVLDFGAFEGWLNEDEVLVAHPHDPFKRIDVLATARRIEVRLDATVLASTVRALMLVETHLPVRYYIPPQDVRMDLLGPSTTRSACAYKGHASYLSTVDEARPAATSPGPTRTRSTTRPGSGTTWRSGTSAPTSWSTASSSRVRSPRGRVPRSSPRRTPTPWSSAEHRGLPDPALVVLVGASGSGQVHLGRRGRYRREEVVSSDALRGVVGSGPHDLDASEDAFALLEPIVAARLGRGLATVVDTLGTRRRTAPALAGRRPRRRPARRRGGAGHPGRRVPAPQRGARPPGPGAGAGRPAAARCATCGPRWTSRAGTSSTRSSAPSRGAGAPAARSPARGGAERRTSRGWGSCSRSRRFPWGEEPAAWLRGGGAGRGRARGSPGSR